MRAADTTPLVESVEQKIALNRDAEGAHWWFSTMTETVTQRVGRDFGRSRYGQLTLGSLLDLGDETSLMFLPRLDTNPFGASTSFYETYLNIRVDRLVGTVRTVAVFGDPKVERQIQALGGLLARRMSDALRAAA